MADHSLKSARHRCHGRPLPHHQANVAQAPQSVNAYTEAFFHELLPKLFILCGISQNFSWLSPTKRQITYVLLTRAPLYSHRSAFSFDLHVLSMPPAFVLSQDQTLKLNSGLNWINKSTQPKHRINKILHKSSLSNYNQSIQVRKPKQIKS